MENIIGEQALSSMKSIFGGNPTEGERAILLDLQASASKTPKQRAEILNRAMTAANRRIQFSKQKADDIKRRHLHEAYIFAKSACSLFGC